MALSAIFLKHHLSAFLLAKKKHCDMLHFLFRFTVSRSKALSLFELSVNWWSLNIATGPLTSLKRCLHALFSDFFLMNSPITLTHETRNYGSGGENLSISFTNCISDVFLLLIFGTLYNVAIHSICPIWSSNPTIISI